VKIAASAAIPLPELITDPAARLLGCVFFLAAIAILGTVVHFVPMLTDWGLSPAKAGATASLIGVAAIGGRLIIGALLDRWPAHRVTVAVFGTTAIGMALLGSGAVGLTTFGAAVIGLAVGAEVDLIAFLVGRFFPRRMYGQIYGAIYATFLAGGAIGPALSGFLHDLSGSYRLSLRIMAGLMTIAALLASRISRLALARPTPQRVTPEVV
jgi:MFS family permease